MARQLNVSRNDKPGEFDDIMQLMQMFSMLQEPGQRQAGLDLEREKMASGDRLAQQKLSLEERQMANQQQQFDVTAKGKETDNLLESLTRLGSNPNIDMGVLMKSMGKLDPRLGEVYNESEQVKSRAGVSNALTALSGATDPEVIKKTLAEMKLTPEQQLEVYKSFPNIPNPAEYQPPRGDESIADLLPASKKPLGKKKETTTEMLDRMQGFRTPVFNR